MPVAAWNQLRSSEITCAGGHARSGANANSKPTFVPGHLVGADQAKANEKAKSGVLEEAVARFGALMTDLFSDRIPTPTMCPARDVFKSTSRRLRI